MLAVKSRGCENERGRLSYKYSRSDYADRVLKGTDPDALTRGAEQRDTAEREAQCVDRLQLR